MDVLSSVGQASNIVLIDVNPLTLGIETVGGVMTKPLYIILCCWKR